MEQLLERGLDGAAIAKELGIGKSTVAYHRRRLGYPVDVRCSRRFDWREVQAHHDDGHPMVACLAHFGMNRSTWYDAIARGELVPRPSAAPLDELLVLHTSAGCRPNLRRRLLREGVKDDRCEGCGITEWLQGPIAMQLHHVNGNPLDDRLDNLQLLCPNCHSQTDNWAGRNKGSRSCADRDAA